MVTIICYISTPGRRYHTTATVTKLSLTAAWAHISRCPHGHALKMR